ncbi:MAG: hypothetical protein WDW36_003818 [Sanguina aurantia]
MVILMVHDPSLQEAVPEKGKEDALPPEQGEYCVVNFYHLVEVAEPLEEMELHRKWLAGRDVQGRIYISSQGINAQCGGSLADAGAYAEWVASLSTFQGLRFTVWPAKGRMFPKLRLKFKPSLVSLAGGMTSLPVTDPSARATPLQPAAWKQMLADSQVSGQMNAIRVDSDRNSEWESAIVAAGGGESYYARHEKADEASVIQFLAFDADNPSSIVNCIEVARRNARAVRTALTADMWEAVNTTWQELSTYRNAPMTEDRLSEFLDWVKARVGLFHGVCSNAMLRRDGFHFVRVGQYLERADNTSRLLDVKYHVRLPSVSDVGGVIDYYQWLAILRVVGARRAYRVMFKGQVEPAHVAELLIMRDEFICRRDPCRHSSKPPPFPDPVLLFTPAVPTDCNELFISCTACQTRLRGCCCEACLSAPRLLRPQKTEGYYSAWESYAEGEEAVGRMMASGRVQEGRLARRARRRDSLKGKRQGHLDERAAKKEMIRAASAEAEAYLAKLELGHTVAHTHQGEAHIVDSAMSAAASH